MKRSRLSVLYYLSKGKITISNIPDILDVNLLIELLQEMGVKTERPSRHICSFQADDVNVDYLNSETYRKKSGKLRGSVMLAGPLLARFKKAFVPKPGGDKIGRRRLDTHMTGFEKLGARFSYDPGDDYFRLEAPELKRYLSLAGRTFRNRYGQYCNGCQSGQRHNNHL